MPHDKGGFKVQKSLRLFCPRMGNLLGEEHRERGLNYVPFLCSGSCLSEPAQLVD